MKKIKLISLNQVKKLYVHGVGHSDHSETELTRESISISSLGSFIEDLENEIYPKEILSLDIDFINGNKIHFNTGEVSLLIKDPDELENFVTSLLKVHKFKDTDILAKLKEWENNYFTVRIITKSWGQKCLFYS